MEVLDNETKGEEQKIDLATFDPMAEARKEVDAENPPEKDTDNDTSGDSDASPNTDTEDNEVNDDNSEEQDQEFENEDDDGQSQDDNSGDSEEKELSVKVKEYGLPEDSTEDDVKSYETEQEEIAKEIEDLSIKKGISIEDAKEDYDKINGIFDKYNGNKRKLAYAQLNSERKITEQAEIIKNLQAKESARVNLAPGELIIEDPEGNERIVTEEAAVEAFSKKFPLEAEGKTHEELLEAFNKDYTTRSRKWKAERNEIRTEKLKNASEKKLKVLMSNLPDSISDFKSDIEKIVGNYSPETVLGEGFSLKNAVALARGLRADEIEEKAYERGRADSKVKKVSKVVKGGSSKTQVVTKLQLTDSQKRDMRTHMPQLDVNNPKHVALFWDAFKIKYGK